MSEANQELKSQGVNGQRKRHSITEAILSTLIGFGVAYAANFALFPLFGYELNATTNLWFTSFFTAISVIRSYFVRRMFNYLHIKGALK